jgi:hypothetical protein
MSTEIVKIDPREFGLTDQTAKNIKDQFLPMLTKMEELEEEFNEIVSLPIEDKETQNRAKELRNRYVKIRTGTDKIHKTQKEFYLKGGKFVDGWKNAQRLASHSKEERLKEIEEYEIRLEAERVQKLNEDRLVKVAAYVDDTQGLELGSMPQDVFDAYLAGKKRMFAERQEAEAEAKRLEDVRLKALEISRQRTIKASKFPRFWELLGSQPIEELKEEDFQAILADAERLFWEDRKRIEQEAVSRFVPPINEGVSEEKEPTPLVTKNRTDKEILTDWVNSFAIPQAPWIDTDYSLLIQSAIEDKFNSFKNWAKKQIELS